ncbi:hypothetical protein SBADM41S_11013 [Streptomyces badius]
MTVPRPTAARPGGPPPAARHTHPQGQRTHAARQPHRALDVRVPHVPAGRPVQDGPVLDAPRVRERAAQPYAERPRERRLDRPRVRARVAVRVRFPGAYGLSGPPAARHGQRGRQPGARPPRHIVQARRGPAVTAVTGRLVADHRVQRVHRPEADEPRYPADRPPHQRADDGVRGVLGDRLDDRAGDPRPVQGVRIAPAQVRQPLPGRLQVPGDQRAPDGAGLPAQRRHPDHGPGGGGGQRDGERGASPYGAGGQRGGPHGASGAHQGVQRAPATVVTPQQGLDARRGAAESGDGVAPPRIAEQRVGDHPRRGAVREDAIGTHGSACRGKRRSGTERHREGHEKRRTAAGHGVGPHSGSAPWFDVTGDESLLAPGSAVPPAFQPAYREP